MNIRDRAELIIPDNAPALLKRNPLASAAAFLTIIVSLVTVLSYFGIKPPQPLDESEAYVTHEQFNLLMVNIVKAVDQMEQDLEAIKNDINTAIQLRDTLDSFTPGSGPDPIEEESDLPPVVDTLPKPATINVPPLAQPAPPPPAPPTKKLKDVLKNVETLQLEQRMVR